MNNIAPWSDPLWVKNAEIESSQALKSRGIPPEGPLVTIKNWGRSYIQSVPTNAKSVQSQVNVVVEYEKSQQKVS
jgi:hypothetical protein